MSSYKQTSVYANFVKPNISQSQDIYISSTDSTLVEALKILEDIEFDASVLESIKDITSTIPFKTGKEAVDFAKKEKIQIIFDKVSSAEVHAQWQNWRNTIVINEKYKGTKDNAEIYAISAAILHELAHAKDKDSISSIQEEIDCLSMNALAFAILQKKNHQLFKNSHSPILADGVMLYSQLFFQKDKSKLADRIKLKYGELEVESPNHSAKSFAKEIKKRGI